MLTSTFCPTLSCCSITILIALVDTILFIVTVAIGLNKEGQFLEVQTQTLLNFGASYSNYIYHGQVYRLVAPIILHGYFMHYLGNVATTLILVSRVEHTLGWYKTLIIYVLSGIFANIFSALINPGPVKIGASTSLYGIIGVIIGYIIINWNGIDGVGQIMKCQIYCSAMMIIVFTLLFTSSSAISSSGIDYWGHFGGFLSGLWLSFIHASILNTGR